MHLPAGRPAWYGLRTTERYDNRRWVYTEYETGERELYDLGGDPWQLRNLAGQERLAGVEASLAALLHDRVVTPDDVRFLGRLRPAGDD